MCEKCRNLLGRLCRSGAKNPRGDRTFSDMCNVVACLEQVTRSSATLPLASLATAPYPHACRYARSPLIPPLPATTILRCQLPLRQGEFCLGYSTTDAGRIGQIQELINSPVSSNAAGSHHPKKSSTVLRPVVRRSSWNAAKRL